ncbi:hypothetical protein PR048_032982 [Dryococelus australis]|uniref:Uncharacterized protein n=1 Tax=Dryococelus australis TaxID=614101 RepID=A0ABQ9G7W3_9NEOP|nr:hypothetical protein PR048_032982 [Dryococelus australis]
MQEGLPDIAMLLLPLCFSRQQNITALVSNISEHRSPISVSQRLDQPVKQWARPHQSNCDVIWHLYPSLFCGTTAEGLNFFEFGTLMAQLTRVAQSLLSTGNGVPSTASVWNVDWCLGVDNCPQRPLQQYCSYVQAVASTSGTELLSAGCMLLMGLLRFAAREVSPQMTPQHFKVCGYKYFSVLLEPVALSRARVQRTRVQQCLYMLYITPYTVLYLRSRGRYVLTGPFTPLTALCSVSPTVDYSLHITEHVTFVHRTVDYSLHITELVSFVHRTVDYSLHITELVSFVRWTVDYNLHFTELANRIRFSAESLPDFRTWESCWTIPLCWENFDGDFRFPLALAYLRCPTLTSLHSHRLSRLEGSVVILLTNQNYGYQILNVSLAFNLLSNSVHGCTHSAYLCPVLYTARHQCPVHIPYANQRLWRHAAGVRRVVGEGRSAGRGESGMVNRGSRVVLGHWCRGLGERARVPRAERDSSARGVAEQLGNTGDRYFRTLSHSHLQWPATSTLSCELHLHF